MGISQKNDEKLLVFHVEQKTEFEKFNCFFVNFFLTKTVNLEKHLRGSYRIVTGFIHIGTIYFNIIFNKSQDAFNGDTLRHDPI